MKRKLGAKSKEWRNYLEAIWREVSYLRKTRLIYLEMANLINLNLKSFSYTFFRRWFLTNYGICAAMSIRRLVDKDPNTRSLLLFLKDIQKHHSLITRDMFVKGQIKRIVEDPRYKKGNWVLRGLRKKHERLANKTFTKWVGKRTFLSPFSVELDIKQIELVSANIKKYVNQYIAHHSFKKKINPPPRKDLHKCLTTFTEILQKYNTLISGGKTDFIPSKKDIKKDIKAIFSRGLNTE